MAIVARVGDDRRIAFETSHTEVEARLLQRHLCPDACVLDAGCGRRTRLAAHRDRIAQLVGTDLDAVAGEENSDLDRFTPSDLCASLPFEDASFDLVYANFVVEHLDDPATAFSECRRVLRPGGVLVVLTSNQANPMIAIARLIPQRARVWLKQAGAGAAERDVVPLRYRANSPWRLRRLARRTGFVAVEVIYVATLHRYVARQAHLAWLFQAFERCLPRWLRSTIVACYRRV